MRGILFLLIATWSFSVYSCAQVYTGAPRDDAPQVKNIILLIGDGWGPQQLSLALSYARRAPSSTLRGKRLAIEEVIDQGALGLALTSPAEVLVADSAASASQLASGTPSLSQALGLDAEGRPVETVLERAAACGRSTGLVTDTRITDATPAAFAAHVAHRSLENEIAVQYIEKQVDLLLGGGLRHFLPTEQGPEMGSSLELQPLIESGLPLRSKRNDARSIVHEAAKSGYALAFTREQLAAVHTLPVLGLFAPSGLPDALARRRAEFLDAEITAPSLPEMTAKGLRLLSKNPNGFFLMVEVGQIDWAGHQNDAGRMLHESLLLDEVVGEIFAWVRNRRDTLFVIVGDHETGSFGFSYSGAHLPPPRTISTPPFLGRVYQPEYNFGSPELLDQLYEQRMSFDEIFRRFDALPPSKRNAASLEKLVNENISFLISRDEAQRILATTRNPFYRHGHRTLGERLVPKIDDFAAFYPDPEDNRPALLARAIAPRQNIVWGTGTHTAVVVPVVSWGPAASTVRLKGILDTVQVGQVLKDVVSCTAGNTHVRWEGHM